MTKVQETPGAGHFLLSEANGSRSRQRRTFATGQTIKAGEVYGIVTASGDATKLAPAATDGSQNAAGVAYSDITTTTAKGKGVGIERDAEVATGRLFWPAGITAPQQAAALTALAAKGIIARS